MNRIGQAQSTGLTATFDSHGLGILALRRQNAQYAPFVIDSTFSGNHAAVGGGAIENESAGITEVFNATFWNNSALAGVNELGVQSFDKSRHATTFITWRVGENSLSVRFAAVSRAIKRCSELGFGV